MKCRVAGGCYQPQAPSEPRMRLSPHRAQALIKHLVTPSSQKLPSRYAVVYGILSQVRTAVSNIAVTIIHTSTVIPFKSFHVIQHHVRSLHIFTCDLQVITGNACRNRKLLVIQQVGSSPTLLKATSCRNSSIFFVLRPLKNSLTLPPVLWGRIICHLGGLVRPALFIYNSVCIKGLSF